MAALLEGVAAHAAHGNMDSLSPDAATLARALFDDVPSAVAICDATDLSLIAVNAAARSWVGPPRAIGDPNDPACTGEDLASRTLYDLLPRCLRDPHHAAVTQATQTGRPVRIVGMVRGRWTATVYRPTTLDAVTPALLCIWSPVAEDTRPRDGRVVSIRAAADDLGPLEGLTERELEILRLIGLGLSSEQIARELHRSVKTVQGHRNALGLKLGIDNRVELARIAVRTGVTGLTTDQTLELGRRARRAKRRNGPAATATDRAR